MPGGEVLRSIEVPTSAPAERSPEADVTKSAGDVRRRLLAERRESGIDPA